MNLTHMGYKTNKTEKLNIPHCLKGIKDMMTKKVSGEEGIYKTLLKAAQVKAKEERRERFLSFWGEGGRGGALLPTF